MTAWNYRLLLAWERRKIAVSEALLRLRGVEGELLPPPHSDAPDYAKGEVGDYSE